MNYCAARMGSDMRKSGPRSTRRKTGSGAKIGKRGWDGSRGGKGADGWMGWMDAHAGGCAARAGSGWIVEQKLKWERGEVSEEGMGPGRGGPAPMTS